jgi:hypothetical protein
MKMDEGWDIPDDYLAEIGRVTVRWSKLESHLNFCSIQLSGNTVFEPRAHVLVTHMSFPQKIHALGAMVVACLTNPAYSFLSNYKKDVEPLLNEASRMRNGIIHCNWGMENGVVGRSDVTARGALKMTRNNASITEVEEASEAIVKASDALVALVTAGSPSSDKPHSGQ